MELFRILSINSSRRYDSGFRPLLCHFLSLLLPPSSTASPFLSLFVSLLCNCPSLSLPYVINQMDRFRILSSMAVGGKTHVSVTFFFIDCLHCHVFFHYFIPRPFSAPSLFPTIFYNCSFCCHCPLRSLSYFLFSSLLSNFTFLSLLERIFLGFVWTTAVGSTS